MKRYAKYKDSGISWIGDVPEHWTVSSLRKHLRFISDKGHPNEQLLSVTREQGVIIRNVESKEENHNFIPDDLSGYKLVVEGQFAINKMKAWQGSYAVSSYTGIVSPAYYICELKIDYKPFFNLAIRSRAYIPFFTMYSKGIRVDQWDLSPIGLKSIPFFVPPPEEQKAIAEFLDSKTKQINELVFAKQKQIELLKEYKQAVIAKAVTQGINPKAKMKDSGISWIGQIPEHWDITRIRHVFEESDEKIEDNSGILLSLSQYTGISLKSDCEKTGMSEAESTEGYKIVHKGQFVMNIMLAWNGSYAVSDLEGIISPAYCVFNFITKCNQWYIHYLLRIKAYSGAFKTLSKGIIDSRLRLYPNKFYTFPVIVPPPEEQSQIVAFIKEKVSAIDSQIASVEKQIANLNEYKQSLISDVVTGKVKVA